MTMTVHPLPAEAYAIKNKQIRAQGAQARTERFAGSLPGGDRVTFGNGDNLVVSPRLNDILNTTVDLLDQAQGAQFKSTTGGATLNLYRNRSRDLIRLSMDGKVINSEWGRLVLTFQRIGRQWQLDPNESAGYQGLTAETVIEKVLSPDAVAQIRPEEYNDVAIQRAHIDATARKIAVPLARLVRQFPIQGGFLRYGSTTPVPLAGYTAPDTHLQLLFKRNTYEVLIGSKKASGIEPFIRFEFDGLGEIVNSTLDEREAELLRGNMGQVGIALINALLMTVANEAPVRTVVTNLLNNATDTARETLQVPGGSVDIQPGQVNLRGRDGNWSIQWNAPRNASKAPVVHVENTLPLDDQIVENLDTDGIAGMLQHAHVRSQGGMNALLTNLYLQFAARARANRSEANAFFDPVEQLMAWHVDKNTVMVFGDLDDVLNQHNKLPAGLKQFAEAQGLGNPRTAAARFGPGIPWRDAVVLGWYDERFPSRKNDAVLLVMSHDNPLGPPQMVVLPLNPDHFNRRDFNRVVSADAMRTIAEAVRYPISPLSALVDGKRLAAESPVALTSALADNAEQLVVEIPQYREVVRHLLSELSGQFGTVKQGVNGTIDGIITQIDELQRILKAEFVETERQRRAEQRFLNKRAYSEAQQRAAEAMNIEVRQSHPWLEQAKAVLSDAFTRIRDELSIQAEWALRESRMTEAARRKAEVNEKKKAVHAGFRLNEREIGAIVQALQDITRDLNRIEEISARMSETEAQTQLLSLSGPNIVARHMTQGKGYGPFEFDERIGQIRGHVARQVQDYETVVTLQNTIITNLANVGQHITASRQNIRQLVGQQARLSDGNGATTLALQARVSAAQGQLPQLSPLAQHKLRLLSDNQPPERPNPALTSGEVIEPDEDY